MSRRGSAPGVDRARGGCRGDGYGQDASRPPAGQDSGLSGVCRSPGQAASRTPGSGRELRADPAPPPCPGFRMPVRLRERSVFGNAGRVARERACPPQQVRKVDVLIAERGHHPSSSRRHSTKKASPRMRPEARSGCAARAATGHCGSVPASPAAKRNPREGTNRHERSRVPGDFRCGRPVSSHSSSSQRMASASFRKICIRAPTRPSVSS